MRRASATASRRTPISAASRFSRSVGVTIVRTRDDLWTPVPPRADALVVNIGDLLARWSNDRFASTPHRVVNRAARFRHSIAVFCDPQSDAPVDPRAMALPPDMAPRYAPVTAGEYIAGRNRGAFSHYAGEFAAVSSTR